MKFSIINKKGILLIALMMALLSSCTNMKEGNEVGNEKSYCIDPAFRSEVETIYPEKQLLVNEVFLSGIVEPNSENVIEFKNLTDGIIVNTNFFLGDYVKKGQVMAEVQSIELSEWRAKQKILSSQLVVARQELASIQAMYDDGITSKKELNQAEYEVLQIESELEEINSNLTLYNASTKSNVFLIKAPRSGYVTEKNIRNGSQVRAYEETLFTISELSDVWVQINVYASDLHRVAEGMEVEIRSLSYPDSIFMGRIDALSYVFDKETNVIKARVRIDNEGLLLKPGMFVDVVAKDRTETEALAIPISSIIFDDNAYYVVIYSDDCDLFIKRIECLSQSNGMCFLDFNQVNREEKIISKNHLLIYEQLKNF